MKRTGFALSIRLLAIMSAAAILFTAVSCGENSRWHTANGVVWGTTYNITYTSNRNLDDSIVAVMQGIDRSLSVFNPRSTVSRINRGETDTLDAAMVEVFIESKHINRISGGYFDPTVGPLVNLWGFGHRDPLTDGEAPDSATVAATLERVGMAQCSLDMKSNCVYRHHRHTEFDFSAIAKGYGVDCVAAMLRRNGCQNFMVEIGGEMALAGESPQGHDWRVQVDAPVKDSTGTHKQLKILTLTDCCIATSGNYRNFHTLDNGLTVAHTISPKTGYPVQSRTLSATVIARNCMTADALATAIMAMPLDQAQAMLSQIPDVSALIVISADNGSLRLITTGPTFE